MKSLKEYLQQEQNMPDMKKILADRAKARKHVDDLAQKLAKEKEKKENK